MTTRFEFDQENPIYGIAYRFMFLFLLLAVSFVKIKELVGTCVESGDRSNMM